MLHIERTAAKALATYIRTYSLFKSDSLSINTELTFYVALFRSIMVYAPPILKYAAYAHLQKLQRRQNQFLCSRRTAKCTWLSKFLTFTVLYLIWQEKKAEVVQNRYLLQKTSLTDVLYISYIRIIFCFNVTKRKYCP